MGFYFFSVTSTPPSRLHVAPGRQRAQRTETVKKSLPEILPGNSGGSSGIYSRPDPGAFPREATADCGASSPCMGLQVFKDAWQRRPPGVSDERKPRTTFSGKKFSLGDGRIVQALFKAWHGLARQHVSVGQAAARLSHIRLLMLVTCSFQTSKARLRQKTSHNTSKTHHIKQAKHNTC